MGQPRNCDTILTSFVKADAWVLRGGEESRTEMFLRGGPIHNVSHAVNRLSFQQSFHLNFNRRKRCPNLRVRYVGVLTLGTSHFGAVQEHLLFFQVGGIKHRCVRHSTHGVSKKRQQTPVQPLAPHTDLATNVYSQELGIMQI